MTIIGSANSYASDVSSLLLANASEATTDTGAPAIAAPSASDAGDDRD